MHLHQRHKRLLHDPVDPCVRKLPPELAATLQPFARELIEELIPMVEKNYKVSKKADDRAIAGMSMGGGQSINIAFSRPDLFRYVGLMSPAASGAVDTQYPALFKDVAATNKQFKVLWVGIGKDDNLTGNGTKAFDATLTKAGIKHDYIVGEGRHESVYVNMPPFGLGRAGQLVPAKGGKQSAKGRLQGD